MNNINVPSYNSLLPGDRRIRAIQDLYDYISRWKQETDTSLEEALPKVHDYTSWNSAGTTEEGAGTMLISDQTDRIAIVAASNSYTISNMPVGIEMYIPADPVLDGETLITVYEDTALTVDSNIRVKIGAERDATIGEAFEIIYYLSRNEAIQFAADGLSTKLDNVNADSLFDNNISTEQQKQAALQALLQLEQMYGYTSTTSTNPEYTKVILDSEGRILGGKKVNGDLELFGVVYPANP